MQGFAAIPEESRPDSTREWSARERAHARCVQEHLLPATGPALAGLEYAAWALPAGDVSGDYYDFIRLSPRRLAIALGDVSGKGVAAALGMAALQASLRSHYALADGRAPAARELAARLRSVNRLLRESTPAGRFVTLFLAEYDDRASCLRYANCGHPPGLVLRADGGMAWLGSTATVLGLAGDWECGVAETGLAPGDTLLLYSDGATEARRSDGEEFGEERLAAAAGGLRRRPPAELLAGVADAVRRFAGGRPGDDLTLVAVRRRATAAAVPLGPRRRESAE